MLIQAGKSLNQSNASDRGFKIVGHRGLPEFYPENSLIGMLGAVAAGADAIELDIQFSRDGVPFLCHDASLMRVAGIEKKVWELDASALSMTSCGEKSRFATKYINEGFCSLARFSEALATFKGEIFIEVKAESFKEFDRQFCLDSVIQHTSIIANHRILISFDEPFVELSVAAGHRTGLVSKKLSKSTLSFVKRLARAHEDFERLPDFQVPASSLSYLAFPKAALYQSGSSVDTIESPIIAEERAEILQKLSNMNVRLFSYDIVDKQEARLLAKAGVRYIESWNVYALV